MASLLINFHSEKRLENLRKIVEVQSNYSIIKEIIVWNNSSLDINFENPKVKTIKSSFDVGLRARWYMGLLASHDCLFVQDDDILLSEYHFEILYGRYLFDKDRVYGIFGRNFNIFNRYELDDVPGSVDFVLTRLACFPKTLLPYIFEFEQGLNGRFDGYPIDDITLSAVSRIVYNKKPYSVDTSGFHYENLEDHDKGLHSKNDFNDKRSEYSSYIRQFFITEPTAEVV